MKISFERADKDIVQMEHDGSVLCAFLKSGHIKALSRLRFSTDSQASLNAISVSQATAPETGEQSAPHALVFVTEDSDGERVRIVERFETEGEAEHAANRIRCVIKRQAFWLRLRATVRGIGWYVAFPLMVLSLYGPIVSALNGKGSPELSAAILSEVSRVANSQAAPQPEAPPLPVLPMHISQQLVIEETASVRLMPESPEGQKQEPLVVFSDPKCPACRAVEPTLEALAKERPVVIVPLAYKPGSDGLAAEILCSKDQADTANAWRTVMANGPTPTNGSCDRGSVAVKSNMRVAELVGVTKTPTLMAPDGRLMEGGGTVDQIRTFIASGGK